MPTHLPTLSPLVTLTKNITQCRACPLFDRKIIYRSNNVLSAFSKIELIAIGEAPGMVEYIQNKPFIGPAGQELDALFQECVPPNLGYIILNSISCTPWEDKTRKSKIRTPTTPEAKFCFKRNILPFINEIKPKYLIALGKIAHSCIGKSIPHLHVLHPSAILQSIHQEYERKKFILSVKEYLSVHI